MSEGVLVSPRKRISPWSAVFIALPYIYHLRTVILAGALIALLPLGLRGPAAALLGGMFDLNAGGLFWVSLLVSLLVVSLLVITLLILINGGERFGAHLGQEDGEDRATKIRKSPPNRWLQLGFFLLALPIIGAGYTLSPEPWPVRLLAIGLGGAAAVVLSQVALLIYYLLLPGALLEQTPESTGPIALPGLFRWVGRIDLLSPLYERLEKQPLRLPYDIGQGYFAYPDRAAGTIAWLYPGHLMAVAMSVLTTGIYLGVWAMGRQGLVISAQVPALAYGLLLLLMLLWLLSGAAFFFDRYRMPLVVILVILGVASSSCRYSDYTYPVFPRETDALVTPAEVVGGRDSLIVVAANGGGIQAAAWTAQVLTGLEQRARQEFGQEYRGFGSSIRFISSVSGGSIGAMYVVNAYTPDGLPAGDAALAQIVAHASASSLNDVAYGLVYPDFVRTLAPNPWLSNDRGRALEGAWVRSDPALRRGLTSWREGVEAGWRPAIVFNATISDTGERLLFSTSELDPALSGGQTFSRFYESYDLSIATAARLSAAFPYVSPAARADVDGQGGPRFHVVDGGYYDNYGMATLAEWLDRTLLMRDSPVRRVLVIQIRGAPGSADRRYRFGTAPTSEGCPSEVLPDNAATRPVGWFHQILAPLNTMLTVRDTGQLAHNDTEFKLLQRAWEARGVDVQTATFQYAGADAPLSWHMTQEQASDIQRHWAALLADCYGPSGWGAVRAFLNAAD